MRGENVKNFKRLLCHSCRRGSTVWQRAVGRYLPEIADVLHTVTVEPSAALAAEGTEEAIKQAAESTTTPAL
jgi:hypothetical protein